MKNAYAAGLIDGEGSISLLKANKNETFRHPVIEISNTTYELLQFMKTTFGGSISSHKIYKKHHKPSWSWKLHYDAAISCLEQITPFLLEPKKKRRAELILAEYKKVTLRNGRYNPQQIQEKFTFENQFFSL
jgi:hypothetical protein